jgi:hypothetical protein
MELTMPQDYREKYFDEKFKNIDSGFERLEKVIAENTRLTREVKDENVEIDNRLGVLERDKTGEVKKKDLPPFLSDPIVRKTLFILSLSLLAIVIAATQVDVLEFIK